jgi:uncharacterized repeat protein (TIGR03803 family)
LVMDNRGNIFGTANSGGKLAIHYHIDDYINRIAGIPDPCSGGLGTVFMISPSGVGSVLRSFCTGDVDPQVLGGLIIDACGNLYGTTSRGGTANEGTVFKVTPTPNLDW